MQISQECICVICVLRIWYFRICAFDKVADLQACNFIKKRFQHRYFPVRFANFLWTLIVKNSVNDYFYMNPILNPTLPLLSNLRKPPNSHLRIRPTMQFLHLQLNFNCLNNHCKISFDNNKKERSSKRAIEKFLMNVNRQ